MGRSFYHPVLLIAFCLSFAFAGCSSGGGGADGDGDGGGGGGSGTDSFEMAAYFPLRSSWETDNWTLVVDAADYDINGTATKAMADTRDQTVRFWTNDENGWMLHGFLDKRIPQAGEAGFPIVAFEAPILFANSSCRVSDKHEGTQAIDGEEISYSIELVSVENVTVPAGTFNNCLKFVLHFWPSSELPSAYGYETFWLAKNVGFVKGTADDNSGSELFTDVGKTRKLLSYHITPTEMTDDERAVRAASELFNEYFEYHRTADIESAADLISEDYFGSNCYDKATYLYWYSLYPYTVVDNFEVISIADVTVDGNDAFILEEHFSISTVGDWHTNRKELTWSRYTKHWRKEIDGEWRHYGAQLGFKPSRLDVRILNDNGDVYLAILGQFRKCVDNDLIDSPDIISSFTVTGPPGSGINDLDLTPYWLGDVNPTERYFFHTHQLLNAVNGFYTFRVENQSGDYYIRTDYLEVTPAMDSPVLLSPADGAEGVSPTSYLFEWEPVEHAASYISYIIDLMFYDNGTGTWLNVLSESSFGYTFYTINLDPNTEYRWRVSAHTTDLYNDVDNEARSGYYYFTTSGE